MEPISLILGALLAGATKGAGEATGTAVKDAYVGLRDALKRKFASKPPAEAQAAETAVTEYTTAPDVWRPALEMHLRQTGAATDQDIIDGATAVMTVVDPEGVLGGKYRVNLTGAHGVQVGDGNTQTNYFGPPIPPTG